MKWLNALITVLLLVACALCALSARADTLQGGIEQNNTVLIPQQPQYAQQETRQLSGGAHQGYAGIGATIGEDPQVGILTLRVIPDSPAGRQDVKPGDIVVAVNGESMQGHDQMYVIDRVLGLPGTPVTVAFQRSNDTPPITKHFIRQSVDTLGDSQDRIEYQMILRQLGWQP